MPQKESEQPRRAPFNFSRLRRVKAVEAARPIAAQPVRTAAPSQRHPEEEMTRSEQVAQPSPGRPRQKTMAQRSKKRKQIQDTGRRSGKELADEAVAADKAKDTPVLETLGNLPEYLQPIAYSLLECGLSDSYDEFTDTGDVDLMTMSVQHLSKALLAMRMSLEKARLGAAKGENDLKEEIAKLKQSLEDVEVERALSTEAANRYLKQKTAAMRTVDFQKMEPERRAEEVKELQRTTARLSKEVGEKDQELQTTLMWAQRVEQEMEASEKKRLALRPSSRRVGERLLP
ncbi:uncharacterized protein LOC116144352 [Pistacia vera]|uniref:uncharacterized protein LOC116144352 n=1 Tax=Pistacia vera TaxID=55513 RepID=UPI001262E18B|nr:uncharacterized protein LOC116144352 [Pistacia vera]